MDCEFAMLRDNYQARIYSPASGDTNFDRQSRYYNGVDAEGNPTITVGAYQEIAKKGEYTWSVAAGTLGATQANTAYRLNLSAPVTTYTAMGILELVYEQE